MESRNEAKNLTVNDVVTLYPANEFAGRGHQKISFCRLSKDIIYIWDLEVSIQSTDKSQKSSNTPTETQQDAAAGGKSSRLRPEIPLVPKATGKFGLFPTNM